jgi:DNA-directed RNA polymerase subunit RPC12/RpoP
MNRSRECLNCGMHVAAATIDLEHLPPQVRCPKCDGNLYLQTDGSCLTRDIAHNRETVNRAMDKLDQCLTEAWSGYAASVRLVVGGGLIREQILGQLLYYRDQGRVRDFREDSPNRGAIVVTIR